MTSISRGVGESDLLKGADHAVDEFLANPSDICVIESVVASLEKSVRSGTVDDRVELAWKIVARALIPSQHAELGRRALYAAFPPQSRTSNSHLYRRWLLALGVYEFHCARAGPALKALSASLELSRELGSGLGEANVISNLTLFAAAAGRYDDALYLDEQARLLLRDEPSGVENLRASNLNRGNALFRLGRLDEAVTALSNACLYLSPRQTVRERASFLGASLQVAEIFLRQGRSFEARSVVENVEAHLRAGPSARLLEQRCRAIGMMARNDLRAGIELLERANAEEAEESDGVQVDDGRSDILHTLQWAYRELGDEDLAESVLSRIGDRMLKSALTMVDGLREAPAFLEHLGADAKLQEIDQYLVCKRVLPAAMSGDRFGGAFDCLISTSAAAISVEDPTLEHGVRVSALSRRLAVAAGLTLPTAAAVERAALVHDIGKVAVPSEVLRKKSALTNGERDLLDAHARLGAEILERADFEGKRIAVNVARFHHAPFDGHGGRQGPKGEEIPLEARIVAICDRFDALWTGRPSHDGVGSTEALAQVFRAGGRDFDPALVALFVDVIRTLQREHGDLAELLSQEAERIEYFAAQRALKRAVRSVSSGL